MTIAEMIMDATEEAVGYSSDECLKCNVCVTVCPVARVTDLFPGPKYVGPQAQRFRTGRAQPVQIKGIDIAPSPDVTVDYCSGCGWCTTACPAGVKIAEMNSQSRARMKAGKRPKLRDWGLGQTDLVGQMGVLFSPIANRVLFNGPIRTIMERTVGIHRDAPFPKFGKRTLQSTWKRRQKRLGSRPLPGPDKAVVYFHGCSANYYEQHVADAAVAILKRNGFETIIPEQVCCGLPMISNALYADARNKARTATEAQEEERKRLSRELHDDILQSLAVVRGQVEASSTCTQPGADTARLTEALEILTDTMGNVRRYCKDLRPSAWTTWASWTPSSG